MGSIELSLIARLGVRQRSSRHVSRHVTKPPKQR
jgi:hypothetical protein